MSPLTPKELEELITRVINDVLNKYNFSATDNPEIIEMEDASKFLCISPATIKKYVRKKEIKRALPNVKGYRFFRAELTRFANHYRP
jgi:hypothetical protein